MQSEQALQQSSVEEIFKRVPSKNFLSFQPPNFPQAPSPPPFEALKQTYVARQEGKSRPTSNTQSPTRSLHTNATACSPIPLRRTLCVHPAGRGAHQCTSACCQWEHPRSRRCGSTLHNAGRLNTPACRSDCLKAVCRVWTFIDTYFNPAMRDTATCRRS